ncbi:MAG TPA: hypothetical protein VIG74_04625 [Alphaproteobacteria bacterium]|jgi:hypothetical protein
MTVSFIGKSILALSLTSIFMAGAATADEFLPPPPVAFENNNDPTITYSLTGPDTVEYLKIHEDKKPTDITIYDFANKKARYFQLHNHESSVELTQIALKPFWDVDRETLEHARTMGCKAALTLMGTPEDTPYLGEANYYMKTHCPPHP